MKDKLGGKIMKQFLSEDKKAKNKKKCHKKKT